MDAKETALEGMVSALTKARMKKRYGPDEQVDMDPIQQASSSPSGVEISIGITPKGDVSETDQAVFPGQEINSADDSDDVEPERMSAGDPSEDEMDARLGIRKRRY